MDIKSLFPLIERVFVMGSLVYFGFGVILFVAQESYIYQPDKTPFEDCMSFAGAERISSGSSRGYLTRRSQDKITVYYHGNAGRACDRAFIDPLFSQRNYSTYFVEYSGYAEKRGTLSMANMLKNVDDTIEFLKTQHFKEITVIGESVGVGPAAYHAKRSRVDNLILVSAYDNLASVASFHYPLYPMRLLLRDNFTPDIWLSQYQGTVSVILAEQDEVIPVQFGKKLYDGIPSRTKNIFIVKDAYHNTLYEKEEFRSVLKVALGV